MEVRFTEIQPGVQAVLQMHSLLNNADLSVALAHQDDPTPQKCVEEQYQHGSDTPSFTW